MCTNPLAGEIDFTSDSAPENFCTSVWPPPATIPEEPILLHIPRDRGTQPVEGKLTKVFCAMQPIVVTKRYI